MYKSWNIQKCHEVFIYFAGSRWFQTAILRQVRSKHVKTSHVRPLHVQICESGIVFQYFLDLVTGYPFWRVPYRLPGFGVSQHMN